MVEFSDYIVFADESGDHGLEAFSASFPVFVLAFTLVSKATYDSSGLQLADPAARPIGLHSMRPNQSNRAFDVLRPKLMALKSFP